MVSKSERPEIIRKMLEKSGEQELDPTMLSGSISRGMQLVRLIYRAFSGKKPVAWINVFTPPELLYACGCVPFWMDGTGGFSAWMEMNEVFDHASRILPSGDMCTFLRAALGSTMLDMFPPPSTVICTSHLCEGAPKISRMAAKMFKVDFELIDVPGELSDSAIDNVAGRIEQIAHRLCALSGSTLDLDNLKKTIDLSNQARENYRAAYEMRKNIPTPVTGSQFIGMGLVYPWGTEIGVMIAKSLREEIEKRVADNVPAVDGGERHRLMWLHLRPNFDTDIMAHLEQELRALIVSDLIGAAWWPELDPDEPFRALATKMLTNPELLPAEDRIAHLLKLAEEYRVDGVIHFLQWGCRWNYGQAGIYKDAMTKAGLPYLALDGDAVDKRATPHGQILTRIEGFVEMLNSTKIDQENA